MDRVPEPTLIIEGALSKQQPEKSFLKVKGEDAFSIII